MKLIAVVTVLMICLINVREANAAVKCKFNSWKKYTNNRCSGLSASKKSNEANIHKTINSAIKYKKCYYLDTVKKKGVKVKASCRDKDTIYVTFYNAFDTDPSCRNAYGSQEIAPNLRLPPLTLDNKRCESFGPGVWAVPSISKPKTTVKKSTAKITVSKKNQKEIDKAFKDYNKAVDDAASMAVGVLVAIIVGSICAVCICVAICIWACRQGNQTTVVVAGDGK